MSGHGFVRRVGGWAVGAALLAGCGAGARANGDNPSDNDGSMGGAEAALTVPVAADRAAWRVVNQTGSAGLAALGVSTAAGERIRALRDGADGAPGTSDDDRV